MNAMKPKSLNQPALEASSIVRLITTNKQPKGEPIMRKLLTRKALTFNCPRDSITMYSLLRRITLLAILGFTIVSTAQADQLTFSYTDPVADQTGAIDVTKMTVVFDNATGDYEIVLRATAAKPFVGLFRVNVNLFNPDTAPSNSLFQDVLNDFNLATATTKLTLTGTNGKLLAWNAGHRVATNTLAGLGNPPGSSFFRSAVTNFPIGFLTNEDAIAFGPAGVTTIKVFTPQDAIDLLMGDVGSLLEEGLLTQDQADGLMDKLGAAVASLNRGNTRAACNQLHAFTNQVNAFINAGVLLQDKGQELIDAAEAVRGQICFGSIDVSGS
jgi:hypothetical protein